MRVQVAGADGCLGSWVVKLARQRPRPALIAPEGHGARQGGLRDQGIAHIVHLAAALMPVCRAQPVAGGLIDVIGTLECV
jgi:hypothetical protein